MAKMRFMTLGNSADDILKMKSIIVTYPGFQTLPRGLKQMLVASENDFFTDARPSAAYRALDQLPLHRAQRPIDGEAAKRTRHASTIWKN